MLKRIPNGIPCLLIIVALFGYMGSVMGFANMLNTVMHTAHDLLLNTVFYLMGMCVITGALGKIFVEFGVVDLLQKLLRPVMKPLFNMPGVASLAAVLTFLSDNPAIIALSQNKGFARYFKKYQQMMSGVSHIRNIFHTLSSMQNLEPLLINGRLKIENNFLLPIIVYLHCNKAILHMNKERKLLIPGNLAFQSYYFRLLVATNLN